MVISHGNLPLHYRTSRIHADFEKKTPQGRYAVVVFENLHSYLRLNKWNRELLDRYCQHYGAGLVLFSKPAEETFLETPLRGIPDLTYSTNVQIQVIVLKFVYMGIWAFD